jgi:hypothetical protein
LNTRLSGAIRALAAVAAAVACVTALVYLIPPVQREPATPSPHEKAIASPEVKAFAAPHPLPEGADAEGWLPGETPIPLGSRPVED